MIPQGVAAVTKKCTVRSLKAWLKMHMGGDHKENKPILVARVMAHHSQCDCNAERLAGMAEVRGRRRAGRDRGRAGGLRARGRGRGRGGRQAPAEEKKQEASSSDEDVPLDQLYPRRRRRRASPIPDRPRRRIRRMVEEVDQPNYWDGTDASSEVSSLSEISDNEQLETASRPKSSQRLALRSYIEGSETESDHAVNVRLPRALEEN